MDKSMERVDRAGAVSSSLTGGLSTSRWASTCAAHWRVVSGGCHLVSGKASIDYSFVSVKRSRGAVGGSPLYAGGTKVGESIEVRTVKPVSQSYLSSLWTH